MMRKTAACCLLTLSALTGTLAADPPAEPARIVVEAMETAPGGSSAVEIRLEPKDGIKINRYPMIRLQVAAVEGLVADAEARVGNSEPPGKDLSANYFDTVQPLQFELKVEGGAARGDHSVPAKLKYYYCVTKSGYCAPKKVEVAIPLNVR